MLKSFALASAVLVASVAGAAAESPMTTVTYRDKPVNVYLGGGASFPAAFVGQPLCEGGRAGTDARTSCVLLNSDGTGTWENDVGPGQRLPPTPIKWYVIADKEGTVSKVSTDERDTYFVIFEFTQAYYARNAGDMMAFPANQIKGAPGRVVIDSKFRTTN